MEYSIVGPWMAMFWLIAGAVVVLVDDGLVCLIGAIVSFILMKDNPRSMNGKVNPVWGIMIGFNFVALAINLLIGLVCGGEGFALFLNWMVALPTMYMVAYHQD